MLPSVAYFLAACFTVLFSGFAAAWKKKKKKTVGIILVLQDFPIIGKARQHTGGSGGGSSSRVNFLASLIGSSVLH